MLPPGDYGAPRPLPEATEFYAMEPEAPPEWALPISADLYALIQREVNEVADGALVGRRLLDVVHTDDPLPSGLALGDMEQLQDADGKPLPVYRSRPVQLATSVPLWAEFCIDVATVEAAQKQPELATLGDLASVTRHLAKAEDEAVFQALVNAAGKGTKAQGESAIEPLLAAATALRDRGHAGPLATAVRGKLEGEAVGARRLGALQSVFTDGILPAVLPKGIEAIVVEAGAHNARIVVGHNYRAKWIGWDGPRHKFGISVSLAVVISEPGAIELVTA